MWQIKPGQVFDGRYNIKKIIAQGAMGCVYKADDPATGKIVAIKIPHEGYDKDVISLQRFRQAEKIGHLLEHENIVKVYIASDKSSRIPYCVMEFIDGPSLQNLIERYLRINIEDAVNYSLQMCNALAYLRLKNIIHHDIKPANILIGENKIAKLTDFGISFSQDLKLEIWASLVRVGGTPAYMAPEKVQDQSMDDYRSDIYSLGILMYHMMTGKLPFTGTSVEIINNQLTNNFLLPSYLNPEISSRMEKIITKAMAPNPVDRYQYVAELREDLLKVGTINGNVSKQIKSIAKQDRLTQIVLVILLITIVMVALLLYKNKI